MYQKITFWKLKIDAKRDRKSEPLLSKHQVLFNRFSIDVKSYFNLQIISKLKHSRAVFITGFETSFRISVSFVSEAYNRQFFFCKREVFHNVSKKHLAIQKKTYYSSEKFLSCVAFKVRKMAENHPSSSVYCRWWW